MPNNTQNSHTPGPWEAVAQESDIVIYEMGSGAYKHDYDVVAVLDGSGSRAWADAALIAKAPETAAELERVKGVNAELVKALRAAAEALKHHNIVSEYAFAALSLAEKGA